MTQHRNVYSALAAAQAEMDPARKGSTNPAFKSRYADLADIVTACRAALNAHGLAFFHTMVEGAVLRTVIVHGETETLIECDVPLIVAKNDMQGMKSAVTYAKRIGLESLTGIAPEDDDGNAAAASAKRSPDALIEQPAKKANPVSEGLRDAWRDGVMDSLPEGATPRQIAEAFANQIIADFAGYKSIKGLNGYWDKQVKITSGMKEKHPDLHEKVVDAFMTREMELADQANVMNGFQAG